MLNLLAYISPVVFLMFLSNIGWSAETTEVPPFKNIDELIGWIKGKGSCSRIVNEWCYVEISLPAEKDLGRSRPLSSAVKGVFEVFTRDNKVSVEIIRTRTIPLSRNDKTSFLSVVKKSKYWFDSQGRINNEAEIGIKVENSNQELIFDWEVTAPPWKHGDGIRDSILLKKDLGLKWEFAK